jgi:glycosyltransferase involved in cell wall biosynthesis
VSSEPTGHGDDDLIEISVVMPCLNEEASVGICVRKAWQGIRSSGLIGEVIVADNGSADQSVVVAQAAGARVVHQSRRGYGSAYLKGFSAARGRIIVMGDSDDSYDFTVIPELIKPLSEGYDYVLGSRFGGQIRPDAMTWSHRRIGNPVLTWILNLLFGLRVSDAHSGFRALTRTALDQLALESEGMELASEIVVKAARANLRTTEIPIIYHPRIGESKLNSLRDGWRHLRFLLLLSPGYLFVWPGVAATLIGLIGQLLLLGVAGGAYALFDKIMFALVTLGGFQVVTLGLFARAYARSTGPGTGRRAARWARRRFTLEHGLVAGAGLAALGVTLLVVEFLTGVRALATGGLTASLVIGGLTAAVLGTELCFDAFFLGLVTLRRASAPPLAEAATGRSDVASHAGEPAAIAGVGLRRDAT